MTVSTADLDTGPITACDAVSVVARYRTVRAHRGSSVFSEVRQARLQHGLQVAAVSTGLVSVTVAASAAIVLGLSA